MSLIDEGMLNLAEINIQTISYVQPVEPSSFRSCDVVFQYRDTGFARRDIDLTCDYAEQGEYCTLYYLAEHACAKPTIKS